MARNDPIYRFHYFDLRGLGETARYIFAYAHVEYEDVRVKREDWSYQKDTTPFRSLPYLEVDGEQIGQSNALCRFLARRFNLAGRDDLDMARVDALVDYVNGKRYNQWKPTSIFFPNIFVRYLTPTNCFWLVNSVYVCAHFTFKDTLIWKYILLLNIHHLQWNISYKSFMCTFNSVMHFFAVIILWWNFPLLCWVPYYTHINLVISFW